jgi:hypothetical protein
MQKSRSLEHFHLARMAPSRRSEGQKKNPGPTAKCTWPYVSAILNRKSAENVNM